MNEQTRIILAFTHWLYYAEPNFIDLAWKGDDNMIGHLNRKLTGLCKLYGDYMSVEALARFDRELSINHQTILYKFIIENHIDKW